MLSLSKYQRCFLYGSLTDMRKGFDGLSGLVRNKFKKNPLSGDVFIFLNRTRNKIKLLQWQGDGFVVYYKRLEKGTFEFPKEKPEITSQQLLFMLDGIQLSSIRKRPRYEHQNV